MTPQERVKRETKIRLNEAVCAMRCVGTLTAAQWERTYPGFAKAVNESMFIPANRDKWTARVETMRTELDMRIAEHLLNL
jgi:hypothetical protein